MNTIQEQTKYAGERAMIITDSLERVKQQFPYEKYPHYWLTICRTLQTTLNFITEEAKKGLKENPKERLALITDRLKDINYHLKNTEGCITVDKADELIKESFQLIEEGIKLTEQINVQSNH